MRKNLGYKILAILVALCLWSYVNSERNPEAKKTFVVPISIIGCDDNHVAEFADTSNASVAITGQKTIVDSIEKAGVHAIADLSDIKLARDEITKKSVKIKTKIDGVEKNEIDIKIKPQSVLVTIEPTISKALPIETDMQLGVSANYTHEQVKIFPPQIEILGKVSDINRVSRAVVNLGNITKTADIDTYKDIELVDKKGDYVKNVNLSTDRARVILHFIETNVSKTLPISCDITGKPKYPARVVSVQLQPQSITVFGRLNDLEQMSSIHTQKVSVEGMTAGVTKSNVPLVLPAGVTVKGNKVVTVSIGITNDKLPED